MANDPPRDITRLSSPDPATSDGNSSVQVHFDSLSNRGRSIGIASRSSSVRPSPSRAVESSLARQATANSISSLFSSQSSSQPPQNDRVLPEDLLRDLIAVTESSGNAFSGVVHGVKRPRDGEATDEPLPKRDKLTEELDRMVMSQPAQAPITVSSGSSALSASATAAQAPPANGAPTSGPGNPVVAPWTRGTLAIRTPRRPPPGMGNGAAMPLGSLQETLEPGHPADDESDHPSDGSDGQKT
ncbi:hypothetical protein C8A03DRAFT_17767 [Achaetomium macrosporum]|uniref:Uncharacterized protein n=1 Tax=Achaetomium macrosporum TaxID=79813 RepID=A0AAN7C5A7_9PEZI|nr:hypothetical protein C8A03DRAFT_17767 [Achaetomium macrosporum]